MSTWVSSCTEAHRRVESSLKVVDGVLSYIKDTQGKPAARERALFAAAVVFTYGIWENYVEQLAIELAKKVAREIPPENVPERVRTLLDKCTAWELTVSPGWRQLWVQKVELHAIGDDGDKYGLNTAKAGQVNSLLDLAGINDALQGMAASMVPEHVAQEVEEPAEAVNRLVDLRGEIVHTGTVPESLRKKHVREWRQFIENLTDALDKRCRRQCRQLLRRARKKMAPTTRRSVRHCPGRERAR
ncbi:MAG: hypothetical protein WBD63_04580 [Phycisphaerae bacterium]|nr:hypothetical protein [Phycisphaerae bacterium]